MNSNFYRLALFGLLSLTSGVSLTAQEPGAQAGSVRPEVVHARVRVVLSKFQGEKRVSSIPYELSVRTDGPRAQLRMGTQVPVPFSFRMAAADAKEPQNTAPVPVNYKDVGTNIDCGVRALGEGRYSIDISLEDASVSVDRQASQDGLLAGAPQFRSIRSTATLLLRDGQSTQFIAGTDKVSGETLQVDVSMSIVK